MNDDLRSEVLRRRYGGQSVRDIARDLHLSRKTVTKVLCRAPASSGPKAAPACPSLARREGAWWMSTSPRCGSSCPGILI